MEDQDELNIEFSTDILALLNGLRPDSDNANVYTPQDVVKKMLDILPKDIWANRDVKFLDPACKSGVFLREITKRLVDAQIKADGKKLKGKERLPYIRQVLKNQVYGIAISEEAALVSRRTVYGSQNAMSKYSLSEEIFEDVQGNIRFVENATTENTKGAQYPFLNKTIQEIFGEDMHFDVIIGNPPYQENISNPTGQAPALFHKFVNKSFALQPNYVVMIIPAKWYAGGMGLNEFRAAMIANRHIRRLVDYPDPTECFPNIDLRGGVCYFLWDRDNEGPLKFTNIMGSELSTTIRRENPYDVFVRWNQMLSVLQKIERFNERSLSELVSEDSPFGFSTKERGVENDFENSCRLRSSKGFGFVSRDQVKKGELLVDAYKILMGRSISGNLEKPPFKVIATIEKLVPGDVCTHSYIVVGNFENAIENENLLGYLKTRFVRSLLLCSLTGMDISKEKFRFVPLQDFSRSWTDKDLYEKYGITEDEQAFIESMIKPME